MYNCHRCGEEVKSLGGHYRYNEGCRPNLTERQEQIINGLVAGDAHVSNHDRPHIDLRMTNKKFLHHIDRELSPHTTGVSYKESAESIKKRAMETDLPGVSKDSRFNDMYRVCTTPSEEFKQWRGWYGCSGKKIPERAEFTITAIKYWYCCDGYLGSSNRVVLTSVNESEDFTTVKDVCEDATGMRPNTAGKKIYWSSAQSEELFKRFGRTPDGFEYKFP